jgi:hypothetical protein
MDELKHQCREMQNDLTLTSQLMRDFDLSEEEAQGLAFSLLDYEIIISGGTLTPEIWKKGWEAARDEWLAEGPRDPNRLFNILTGKWTMLTEA